MSGDVQPRKRKDKKKKKDEVISPPPPPPFVNLKEEPQVAPSSKNGGDSTPSSEELIHVYKESRLGGNICAKIVFFILLGGLTVMVGLIITEYHGSGEVTTAPDSPWSQMLEGWIDDAPPDKHDDEHETIHDSSEHEEDEHGDHDDGGGSHEEGEEEDDHEEEEEESHEDEIEATTARVTESQQQSDDEFEEVPEPAEQEKNAEEGEGDEGLEPTGGIRPAASQQLQDSEPEISDAEEVSGSEDEAVPVVRRAGPQAVDESGFPEWPMGPDFPSEQPSNTPSSEQEMKPDKSSLDAQLDAAQAHMEENPDATLKILTELLATNPLSSRLLFLQARCLDVLAETQRSNKLLEESIAAYIAVLDLPNVSDEIFVNASDRCINRMRFRGQHAQAIGVHKKVLSRFPGSPNHRNDLAVTYLMIGRTTQAKRLLEETLHLWPDDGFALVHYGFILKTSDNNNLEGARYMQTGIDTGDPGTMDARFLFHLGDALNRLGRSSEALKIYDLGVNQGLFRSKYQRSLYNVDRLTARPWWSLEETTYSAYLRKFEKHWQKIRDEGLAILQSQAKTSAFKDEAENLRDVGDWKQLELYARGRQIQANCQRAPLTCSLIAEFPAARDCRRGQAKFSVMHPGTHVWPHCGPTNCRLRAHLGLIVPKNTEIRVAEEKRSWEEGKVFVFDDSFEHEVWHNGSSLRLILIVDIWHPELSNEERKTLPAI